MPQLKQLSCSIQWADTGAPFLEYGTIYGDGLVETFIVVPNKPQPFTIRLKSLSFVHEGLAVIVFIDGNYQTNRNRVNLRPCKKNMPVNRSQIDFLLRQREKPMGDGVYMGREWRFDNHNIVEGLPAGVKESHFDLLGTIEVLVLRCRARIPEEIDESGSSSAADSDALGEKGERAVIDEDDEDKWVSDNDGATVELAKEQSEDMFSIFPFGADATNDPRTRNSLNRLVSGGPGSAGPPPWQAVNTGHSRIPPQSKLIDPRHLPQHRAHNTSNQTQHPPQQPPATSQKHVRFTNNAQPSTVHPSVPPPVPPKPTAYDRVRQTPSRPPPSKPSPPRPPFLGHQSNHGTSINNTTQQSNNPPRQFQQWPPVAPPNYYPIPQPMPLSSSGPPPHPPPVHYMPQQCQHYPYGPTGNFVPHYQNVWTALPPHVIYNPYQLNSGSHWPQKQSPNSNPSVAAEQDSSKDSNSGISNQQQSYTGENQASSSESDNGGGWDSNKNAAPNTSDNWNGDQNKNSTGSAWDNNTANTPQNNTDNNNWSDNQTGNDNNSIWNNNHSNNNTNFGNNDSSNNDKWVSSGSNNDSQNSGANDSSATNWGKSGGNDSGNNQNNNNSFGQLNNTATSDNNAASGENQDTAEDARALFGPHGQYYTYNPRGPDEPVPDAEEEPRYDVPKTVAEATGSTKQVLPGSGYMYCKRRRAPDYIDPMEEPYARFIFKYRTKDQLEKEIGIKVEVEPTGDEAVQELQAMDKQALIEMLVRAKSALGGKVPSPSLKPTTSIGEKGILVPVEPPDRKFLRYKLPELRQTILSAFEASHNAQGSQSSSSGGVGGAPSPDWNASSNNNNDNTWASKGDNWNANDSSNNANQNWNRFWDGAGEKATTTHEATANSQWNQPNNLQSNMGQQVGWTTTQQAPHHGLTTTTTDTAQASNQDTHNVNSGQSSPSTLPLDQSYNPAGTGSPPFGSGQQIGTMANGPPGAYPDAPVAGQW